MFKFFSGTIDQLLKQSEENAEKIEQIFDRDRHLSHEEGVAYLMDTCKIPKEEAEKLMLEWELEELDKTLKSLEKKGLIQIKSYNTEDGTTDYELTELGKTLFEKGL